ncbi:MAG: PorV/PorQ family protein [Calditrichae bacterium]|nr:PorV/PorQ family protein [Calditrichia bacterium]
MKKIIAILLVSSFLVFAGENDGVTGMSFLKIGVGARAGGMGEAYAAVADDATATYWNPAGLMASDRNNLTMMYNSWLESVNSQFGAVQFRGATSAWGFHVYSLGVDDIPARDFPTNEPVEQFGANYLSLGISHARKFGEKLDIGITAKYLFEKIYVYTANGYAVDFGLRYRLGENLNLAGALQNLGSMNELNLEKTKLPALMRVGASYDLSKMLGSVNLLLAGDVLKPLDEDVRIHVGAEAGVWKQLMLRAGYMSGYENRSVTFGVGIRKTSFQIDYSYTPFDDDFGDSQRFSLYIAI